MPQEIALLPLDKRGYPVPKFASWDADGNPDFVLVDTKFFARAINEGLCWICGGRLGKRMWFVTGPMCTITRTSSEPPCHRGCAIFAVKNCPFMTKPMAKRVDLEGKDYRNPGGVMLERNPGVSALWETNNYKIVYDANRNPLVQMGELKDLTFWAQGRPATADEILESIQTGLPALYALAKGESIMAQQELAEMIVQYRFEVLDKFLPADVTIGLMN
jgi:hypothetical protein